MINFYKCSDSKYIKAYRNQGILLELQEGMYQIWCRRLPGSVKIMGRPANREHSGTQFMRETNDLQAQEISDVSRVLQKSHFINVRNASGDMQMANKLARIQTCQTQG